MKAGDTVVMHNLTGGNPIPHLWFVVTEPDPATHLCAMVGLTTLKDDKDQTVLLNPSEHPFVTQTSAVYFSGALIVDVREIETRIAEGKVKPHKCCSSSLLKLIQQGMTSSPFTPKKVVTFCKQVAQARALQGYKTPPTS
jgi:hypothetical protein